MTAYGVSINTFFINRPNQVFNANTFWNVSVILIAPLTTRISFSERSQPKALRPRTAWRT